MAKNKTKSLFWRIYLIYIVAIVIAIGAAFIYVRGVMVQYENSEPTNYIYDLLRHAGKSDKALGEYLQENCFSEANPYGDPSARSKYFYNTVAFSTLEVSPDLLNSDEVIKVYNVSADGKPFLSVAIEGGDTVTKLGILPMSEWKFKSAFLRAENSTQKKIVFNDDLTADFEYVFPEDFVLTIDKVVCDSFEKSEACVLEDFEYISEYDAVPKGVRVTFERLAYEPDCVILTNDGVSAARLNYQGNSVTAVVEYASLDDARAYLDENENRLIDMGILWSKFMTKDVPGAYHGLDNVLKGCHILAGSNLETMAQKWAHSIDITFVSLHNKIEINNKSISNPIFYNEKFFSADCYFEKVVYLTNGKVRTDVFNNRMYFIKTDNGKDAEEWYWVDMLALNE